MDVQVQIKFLENCDPEDGTGKIFAAGSVKKLNPASARHWIRRGKAVEITDKEVKILAAAKAKVDARKMTDAKAKADKSKK